MLARALRRPQTKRIRAKVRTLQFGRSQLRKMLDYIQSDERYRTPVLRIPIPMADISGNRLM